MCVGLTIGIITRKTETKKNKKKKKTKKKTDVSMNALSIKTNDSEIRNRKKLLAHRLSNHTCQAYITVKPV